MRRPSGPVKPWSASPQERAMPIPTARLRRSLLLSIVLALAIPWQALAADPTASPTDPASPDPTPSALPSADPTPTLDPAATPTPDPTPPPDPTASPSPAPPAT